MHNNKLHILFLNSWYPSRILPTNGDFIQRHAEAVALNNKVTSIHVITDKSLEQDEIIDRNINGVRTIIAYLKPTRFKISKIYQFFSAYKKLVSLCGEFDLVHVNRLYPTGIIAIWLKMTWSKPYIISEHYTNYLQPLSKKLKKVEISISKLIVKQAGYVCPVSENLSQSMQKLGFSGNYRVIPNVVDTNVFIPLEKKNSVFTLVHISSLYNDQKNVKGILRVIKKLENHLPNFLFYLIGDNPFQYNSFIKSLNINAKNIKLIDHITHHKVVNYLQQSDVLLLFSNYENLPCVILESFSCGTKVISTEVGGVNEFFPKDFGALIPAKNEELLLSKIVSLCNEGTNNNKNKMHEYAEAHFSKEKISEEFSFLYHQLITKKQG